MFRLFFWILLCTYPVAAALAQNAILGVWHTIDKGALIQIYEVEERYYGKIVQLRKQSDIPAIQFFDSKNPNASLRQTPLLQSIILKDLHYKKGEWAGGTIYDPDAGRIYPCTIWLSDSNTLKIKGWWGIFSETKTWTRVN